MFRQFCLDRLAAGLSVEVVATEASTFMNRIVSEEDVLSIVASDEIEVRRAELMEEVRQMAPLVTRDALSVLRDIKELNRAAKEKFEGEELQLRDFKTYATVLDLNLKALESISKQLDRISENDGGKSDIVLSFKFDDLERLAEAGVIKIKNKDKAKAWLGDAEVIEVAEDQS